MAADIPAEHHAALLAHASASDRSLAQEVRRALRLYVVMLERDRTSGQPAGNGSSSSSPAPSSTP